MIEWIELRPLQTHQYAAVALLAILFVVGGAELAWKLQSKFWRRIIVDPDGIRVHLDEPTIAIDYEDIRKIDFCRAYPYMSRLRIDADNTSIEIPMVRDNIDHLLFLLKSGLTRANNTEVYDEAEFHRFYEQAFFIHRLPPWFPLLTGVCVTVGLALTFAVAPDVSTGFLLFSLALFPVAGTWVGHWLRTYRHRASLRPSDDSFPELDSSTMPFTLGFVLVGAMIAVGYGVLQAATH